MSYARWSSDDHRSDVYVYPSMQGFVIHMATGRPNISEEQYDALPQIPEGTGIVDGVHILLERMRAVSKLISECDDWIKYEHPLAGETFIFDTPDQAADKLEEIREAGFWVPDGTIEELREEGDFASSAN